MSEQIVIDTDIIIDALLGEPRSVETLAAIELRATLATSAITEMELIIGLRNKSEARALDTFLSRFHVISLNEQISNKAIELLRRYRLSHGLLIQDALIAATAITYDLSFLSKNARDYQFITDLKLLPYTQAF